MPREKLLKYEKAQKQERKRRKSVKYFGAFSACVYCSERMKKHKSEKIGELFMLGQMFFYGLYPILINYGVKFIPPLQFSAYAVLISVPFFLLLSLLRREFSQIFLKKAWPYLIGITFLIVIIPQASIFWATSKTSSINTALLLQMELLWATLICPFFGEKLSGKRVLGAGFVLLGGAFILFKGGSAINIGDLVIFFVSGLQVFGNILAKKVMKIVSWSTILLFRMTLGSIFLLTLAYFTEGLSVPSAEAWPYLLFVGLAIFGLSKIFWHTGLQKLDVTKATAISNSYPVVSLLFAYFAFGEAPSIYQIGGLIFIAIGLFFMVRTTSGQYEDLT